MLHSTIIKNNEKPKTLKRWTTEEDDQLKQVWSLDKPLNLAHRTRRGCLERGYELGLPNRQKIIRKLRKEKNVQT